MTVSSESPNEFGLSKTTMKTIAEIYSRFPQVKKVILYGSRAKGNYREGSDIDMAVVADDVVDTSEIQNMFEESYLPYIADISDFSKLTNSDLIEHINRRGKLLYERG